MSSARYQRRGSLPVTLAVAAAGLVLAVQTSVPAAAQAVVQPLPPAEVTKLNTALRRLARNSRDVDALVDAGNASLAVDDMEAAIGFFGRADELSPGNPRVKVGLAAAFVRNERPLEALRLFYEAEEAGASTAELAGDRGLAYDLVGDNASAQQHYQQALAREENANTRRSFALSHAIAGNRDAFEQVLRPLLAKRNFASYRTRAFGLAILGEEQEAIAIAEAVMPRDLSSRMVPYLRYMSRLTKAQQAAAANLGSFPRAAQIGRDAPEIASYTGPASAVRNADARLAPKGEPLGPRKDTASPRRRPDRGRSAVNSTRYGNTARAAQQSGSEAQPVQAAQSVLPAMTSTPVVQSVPQVAVQDSASVPADEPTSEPTSEPIRTANRTATRTGDRVGASPGFDLANVDRDSVTRPRAEQSSTAPAGDTPSGSGSVSVAEAFADLSRTPGTSRDASSGGVDITAIDVPREVVKAPETKPEPPKHPKRYWVQVATGRDRDALRFDWRRISRKASVLGEKSPFVTPWGQSNRLLAGPYDSLRAARNAVNSLKESEIDSFTFTSADGQEIEPLK